MRKHLPTIAALASAACLAFLSMGANANPISVPINGSCTGLTSCTSAGVTFGGWEQDSGSWVTAPLFYKNQANNETGLGVTCNVSGPKCSQHEINTTPPQYISVDISGIKFSSLSIGIGSDDQGGNCTSGTCTVPETAYIYGATCANVSSCGATLLGSHTGSTFPNNAATFTFTSSFLKGFSFLYVTPLCSGSSCPSAPDANILLASLTYNTVTSVPEPAVLGMFGLGVLLIGVFVGLRRRTQ